MAKKNMKKQITVTMTFTESEVYPSNDPEVLAQNVCNFLNSNLVLNLLSKQLKNLEKNKNFNDDIKKALKFNEEVDLTMAKEMVKSLKVSVK